MTLRQLCPAVLLLLLAGEVGGAALKKAESDADLRVEIRRLRSKLLAAEVNVDDGSAGGSSDGAVEASLGSNASKHSEGKAKRDTWDATLEDVRGGLESEQHLEEQLKESMGSAQWLAGALKNATAQVERVTVRRAEAEKRAKSAEGAIGASQKEVQRKEGQIRKLRSHERWLGKVTNNMLMADKELQARADALTRETKHLLSTNSELSKKNTELAQREDDDKTQMVDAVEEDKKLRSELQETKEEKDALHSFFAEKQANVQKAFAEARREAEVSASSQERLVTQLRRNMTALKNDEARLKAQVGSATSHEHQVEDEEATSEATAKEDEEEHQRLIGELAKQKEINAKLRREKADLAHSTEAAHQKAKDANDQSRHIKAQTCKTMQRRYADALNKKTKMHSALDEAVKLGRRLASDNKKLREAMSQTKQKLAEMARHDGDVSDSLSRQIKELQRQLATREQGLAARRQKEADSTPAAAFKRNDGASLVAHSAVTSSADASSGSAQSSQSVQSSDADIDVDAPPAADAEAEMPPDPLDGSVEDEPAEPPASVETPQPLVDANSPAESVAALSADGAQVDDVAAPATEESAPVEVDADATGEDA